MAWHARHLTSQVIASQKLRPTSFVVVLGSGDGSLVKDYLAAGIPSLGVEPDLGMAESARRFARRADIVPAAGCTRSSGTF